jgi:hypothetical protein
MSDYSYLVNKWNYLNLIATATAGRQRFDSHQGHVSSLCSTGHTPIMTLTERFIQWVGGGDIISAEQALKD